MPAREPPLGSRKRKRVPVGSSNLETTGAARVLPPRRAGSSGGLRVLLLVLEAGASLARSLSWRAVPGTSGRSRLPPLQIDFPLYSLGPWFAARLTFLSGSILRGKKSNVKSWVHECGSGRVLGVRVYSCMGTQSSDDPRGRARWAGVQLAGWFR